MDWRALVAAIVIELGLVGVAAVLGPDGPPGIVSWALHLPGVLLIFYPPGGHHFLLRAAAGVLLQVGLWYLLLAKLRGWPHGGHRAPA